MNDVIPLLARIGISSRQQFALQAPDSAEIGQQIGKLVEGLLWTAAAVELGGGQQRDLRVRVLLPYQSFYLGWVGDVVETHPAMVESLLARGVTPVISPISLGLDGHTYNVNADRAALALACALDAEELIFVSNVPGVLLDNRLVPRLTPAQARAWMAAGKINGGMIPKVHSALAALQHGVPMVRITNLQNLHSGTYINTV